ncbi:MAG: universal stress protein [Ancrocorticia sp.]|uniref:universal stress protein n=1 Tax=Ancrocorticia sp. TaxID=2593684 RepID=UPI003F9246DF
MPHVPPQPATHRLTDFRSHPIVVGIEPEIPELLLETARSFAQATGAIIHFAYVDPSRYVVEEFAAGSVRHEALSPDSLQSDWQDLESKFEGQLQQMLPADPPDPSWEFHYLAGRPDRALTHLARAVDASTIVVGTRAPGARSRLRQILEGSVAYHLTQHQHRPVLSVPLSVVDWKETPSVWDR